MQPFLVEDPGADRRVIDELVGRGWVRQREGDRLELTPAGGGPMPGCWSGSRRRGSCWSVGRPRRNTWPRLTSSAGWPRTWNDPVLEGLDRLASPTTGGADRCGPAVMWPYETVRVPAGQVPVLGHGPGHPLRLAGGDPGRGRGRRPRRRGRPGDRRPARRLRHPGRRAGRPASRRGAPAGRLRQDLDRRPGPAASGRGDQQPGRGQRGPRHRRPPAPAVGPDHHHHRPPAVHHRPRPTRSRWSPTAASSSPAAPAELHARGGRFADLFDRWVVDAA